MEQKLETLERRIDALLLENKLLKEQIHSINKLLEQKADASCAYFCKQPECVKAMEVRYFDAEQKPF